MAESRINRLATALVPELAALSLLPPPTEAEAEVLRGLASTLHELASRCKPVPQHVWPPHNLQAHKSCHNIEGGASSLWTGTQTPQPTQRTGAHPVKDEPKQCTDHTNVLLCPDCYAKYGTWLNAQFRERNWKSQDLEMEQMFLRREQKRLQDHLKERDEQIHLLRGAKLQCDLKLLAVKHSLVQAQCNLQAVNNSLAVAQRELQEAKKRAAEAEAKVAANVCGVPDALFKGSDHARKFAKMAFHPDKQPSTRMRELAEPLFKQASAADESRSSGLNEDD
eukprot:3256942-Prymnesium_polylepis.2